MVYWCGNDYLMWIYKPVIVEVYNLTALMLAEARNLSVELLIAYLAGDRLSDCYFDSHYNRINV
jgi:hypothetical protein